MNIWQAVAMSALALGLHPPGGTAVMAHDAAGSAPADVVADPDPLARLQDANPQYAANKRLVFDMWRSIVNAGHVELADTMLQEAYIQHSPVLPTGRSAFKQIFSSVARTEIPETVAPPLVAMLAERDLVVMALREGIAGQDGREIYSTTHFNLFRIEGGQLAEHWHSVAAPPGPHVLPPEEGGPQPIIGAEGAAQIALLDGATPELMANKRLVFDAWRQVFEGRRKELAGLYIADDFVDHDPNGVSGLTALKQQLARRPESPIPAMVDGRLVAIVAQGDLVVMVRGHEHPHPLRAGSTYTDASFEMFRIADRRIAERWSGDLRSNGGAPE